MPAVRHPIDQTEALKAAIGQTKAKNVILFIGDGMGIPKLGPWRVTMQRRGWRFKGIDLPLTGQYTTYALDKKTQKPNYVTDSAASATAPGLPG